MSHTLIICTCKNRLGFSLLRITLIPRYLIIRGSIDQKHAKTNESGRQISEIHSAFACSRWPLWPYGAYVKREAGNICSVSIFFVRVGSQISPRRAKKDSNIPSPGRTRSVKCPTPVSPKKIKSPPHTLGIGALASSFQNIYCGKILQLSADHHARWPLCKLWDHRFSVPDLVSSLPQPPTPLCSRIWHE